MDGPVDDQGDEERRDQLAEDGAELIGQFTNLVVSGLATPVVGIVSGVAMTRLVRLGLGVWDRLLEPRQRVRAAAAYLIATRREEQREEEGETPRADGVSAPDDGGAAPVDELMEGVMLRAANAHEQRKVPYIGFLWSSMRFRPDLSWEHGEYLLNLADRLTYRQLVALAFFGEHGRGDSVTLVATDRQVQATPFGEGLGPELEQLGDLSLLGLWQREGEVVKPGRTWGDGSALTDFERKDGLMLAALMPTGKELFELMELKRIPDREKDHILDLMRPQA